MRYANIALGAFMVLFAAVQYNDPDPHIWAPIYLLAGAWAFAAAFRLPWFANTGIRMFLAATLVAYVALTLYYWPQTPGFWRKDVWWVDEEAREGMGMMIALAVLLVAATAAFRARSRRS